MGTEISQYTTAVVDALVEDYGPTWNIRARGESLRANDLPWQVVIGFAGFDSQRDGAGGLRIMATFGATILYASLGLDHSSGFQAADIAVTLAAWLANRTPGGVIPENIDGGIRPIVSQPNPIPQSTGEYIAAVYWDVYLDDISLDIDIPGYTTGHPERHRYYQDHGVNITAVEVEVV